MTQLEFKSFQCHECGRGCAVWLGSLPSTLLLTRTQFNELWQLHPGEHAEIKIHGRKVRIPRWQQAYGADYHFSGQVNRALPIPPLLQKLLRWNRQEIDAQLNGLLLNWYDGSRGHYIGPHRDSTKNMVCGAPIVTISFGEERVFRLRAWRAGNKLAPIDLKVVDGSVLVMPFETNRLFTHEVPASKKRLGRRISVTLRAFN